MPDTLSKQVALTRSQKAAAVLVSVGPEASAAVLRNLAEHEVEQIMLEVATLGELDQTQVGEVLQEFHEEAVAHSSLIAGGEHHARQMMRRLHGAEGEAIVDRLLASVTTAPFHFLRMHEPMEVVQHLREEHPQTIALVLAHLPTRFAAALLAGFDADVQAEIAQRVATLDRTSPEVIASVEQALQDRLGSVQRRSHAGRGGVKELAGILNNSDRSTERAILRELEASDPELAEKVRELMFVFEDIVNLDDRAIQEVLRQVDAKQLALALKGVSGVVSETIERNMSDRAKTALQEEMDVLGQVRIRDVEEAQTEIVRRIRELDEAGAIVINRGGEGEFVD